MNVPRINETSTNLELRKAVMFLLDRARDEERERLKHHTVQSSAPYEPEWTKGKEKIQGKWGWHNDAIKDRHGYLYKSDYLFTEQDLAEMIEDGFDLPGKKQA